MLSFLKFCALGLVVLLVGVVSLWLSNAGRPWWYVPVVAMVGAVGVLSSLLLGDENAAFRQAANAIWTFLFKSPAHAGATAAVLLIAVAVCGLQAWRTLPRDTNYFSVMVFRGLRQPAHFAVGAQVVVHSQTDGATHMEPVGNNGLARFDDIPQKTTAVLQINEVRGGVEWAWGAPTLTIKELPDSIEYDLNQVADNEWIRLSGTTLSPDRMRPTEPPTESMAPKETGDRSLQSLNAPWGVPAAPTIINRYGYVLGVDTERRVPLWAAYATTASERDVGRRPHFVPDPALPQSMQTAAADYRGSGYDRGHLVSPSDVRYKGRVAVEEANYQTTLTPQTPALNRRVWLALENASRALSAQLGREIYVISGPLYDEGQVETIGENQVLVPSRFFRVIAWSTEQGTIGAAAYLVPNQVDPHADFQQFALPIAELENISDLTFFPLLSKAASAQIKEEMGRLPSP